MYCDVSSLFHCLVTARVSYSWKIKAQSADASTGSNQMTKIFQGHCSRSRTSRIIRSPFGVWYCSFGLIRRDRISKIDLSNGLRSSCLEREIENEESGTITAAPPIYREQDRRQKVSSIRRFYLRLHWSSRWISRVIRCKITSSLECDFSGDKQTDLQRRNTHRHSQPEG